MPLRDSGEIIYPRWTYVPNLQNALVTKPVVWIKGDNKPQTLSR